MFPDLPPFAPQTDQLRSDLITFGARFGVLDALDNLSVLGVPNPRNPDNPTLPAGFTFLGQFLDHDITLDKRSPLNSTAQPQNTINFRTPVFDLDSVYGLGPVGSPQLYQFDDTIKFLVEEVPGSAAFSRGGVNRYDLPRDVNGVAIVAESRNDENLMISKLQTAFLKFHNAVTDVVKNQTMQNHDKENDISQGKGHHVQPKKLFNQVKQLVTWHYQWIIVHQFLPGTIGQEVIDDIFANGLKFYDPRVNRHQKKEVHDSENVKRVIPLIPIEFSVAAYRFGHSQVRPAYRANFGPAPNGPAFAAFIFDDNNDPANPDPSDLRGGKRAPRRFIDWQSFFPFNESGIVPTRNKKIDTKLSSPLFLLPGTKGTAPGLPSDGLVSLAARNLVRHVNFGLPSGQAIASLMNVDTVPASQLTELASLGLDISTPLWYYCLKEAETLANGEKLGPVCGRIVGEVFIGLLKFDDESYLNSKQAFAPSLPRESPNDFTMSDLLRMAGVVFPL